MCEPVGPNHSSFGDTMYPVSRVEAFFPITINEDMHTFLVEGDFSENIMGISGYDEKLAIGVAAYKSHDYKSVKHIFFELGLEFPGEYLPFYYPGLIYKEENDESFITYFAKAIELCRTTPKKDFTLRIHCGDMLYDSGHYNDAITYYNLAYKEKEIHAE